ncbi:hypothetical protein ACE1TI_12455 [Alteribacillus sp. JSM 102045]|uniref:hypothetical protein n=1 Tax=Alteribacillus sp. JSM 102045 TaxID=1562101 RepID=UPI0035BF58B8
MEIWKIILVSTIIILSWPVVRNISFKFSWISLNYKKTHIPFTVGIVLFIAVINFIWLWPPNDLFAFLIYVGGLWTAGWIDDIFGTRFPKGIKGHLQFLFQKREWTTGLTKIVLVGAASGLSLCLVNNIVQAETLIALSLLILSPHVCNSLDTRPLRVWKWFSIHYLIFMLFLLGSISISIQIYIVIVMAVWGYIEMTRKGMLGDNGAALSGGIMAWVAMQYTPAMYQILLTGILLLMTYFAEKNSIHSFIQKVSILKEIDHWGRREKLE